MKSRNESKRISLGRRGKKAQSQRTALQFERLEPRVVLSSQPLITEFLASNDSSLLDGDGNSSDWIEIHNPTDAAIDLAGWHLTDDSNELDKWTFPATTLESQEYLVVFASGQLTEDYVDPDGNLHTDFSLNADGEYLALTDASENIVHEFSPTYPLQRSDISYGISQGTQTLVGPGDSVNYLVPTDGSLGTTWTGAGFDDSGWTGGDSNGALLITELNLSSPDWIEIQNVSDSSIDTTGWRVAFNNSDNSNINQVYPFYWDFGSSLTSGQVLTTNENTNGVGDVSWSSSEPGWAMILDGDGQVQDFVTWGYSEVAIASFNTTVNGFNITAAELPWTGPSVAGAAGGTQVLRRSGSSDADTAGDFAFSNSGNQGVENQAIAVPFSTSSSGAKLGVGYETNPSQGGAGQEVTNLAPSGTATQSSVSFGGVPDAAIDGNLGNFTHTDAGVNLPSWWQVDLGEMFVLEQIVVHNRDSCCQSRLRDITVEVLDANDSVVFTSSLLNPENVLGGGVANSGPATLDLDLLALNGGSPVFGQTVRVTRTPDPDLSGSNGSGNNDEADVLSLGEVEVMGRDLLSYEQIFQTDLEADLFNQNSTVYLRVPFEVASNPANFDQLLLNVQYDDGFVAYLNGTQIAARNAPGSPSFDSVATAEREDEDAVQFEAIDVTPHLGLLSQGSNLLAIHGLNLSAGDEDFLIVPELVGVSTSTSLRFFETPTPGSPNGEGLVGFVADTKFSMDRGFYDTTFQVEVTSLTPDAEIYYTTNGDAPTPTTGTLYNGAITISETTALRAAAFKDEFFPSNVDTQTYIFVKDVVSQDFQATLDAGFPTSWGSRSPDYGIDPDVIGNFDANGNSTGGDLFGGVYADTIQDDLKAVPTLSIVMNTDEMFGPGGIYTNSTSSGIAWERATSVELINPDGSNGFQVDAGIRIQGGAFRSDGLSKKHSLRLLFKDIYGPTKLNYPFFGEGAVDQFDTITLRMEANDGYAWGAAGNQPQYARDEFGRRSQLALGQPSSHGNRMHVYINGIYWGVYNPVERPDASFAASYYGGDKDEWDAYNSGNPIDGTSASWNTFRNLARDVSDASNETQRTAAYMLVQGKNPDGSDHASAENYLDVDNYIDYLIVNYYGGNSDWPFKNWYAARRRGPESTGFKFHMWDAEWSLNLRSNINTNRINDSRGVAEPYSDLRSSEEFRLRFADRVHRALFNDGALTADNAIDRYQQVLDEMDQAIVAESARWGDMHSGSPHTKAQWEAESTSVFNTFLSGRSGVFLNQLRSAGLYSSVDAPSFNQHGGQVSSGFDLTISAPAGTIYYTLDGSDPREIGGAISSTAMQYTGTPIDIVAGTTVRTRALSGGDWSALNEADFIVAPPADAASLRITELNYNPHDANQNGVTTELEVDNDEFEFVELRNIGTEPIELSGVQFVEVPDGADNEGIEFTFDQRTLAADEFILVVKNQLAFESRYGEDLNIAGEYSGRLSNGGEQITLRNASGADIQSFEYDDMGDWPGQADGLGSSLEVIDVAGDYDIASNWRASATLGGTPGSGLTSGDFDVDNDVDGADFLAWQRGFGTSGGATLEDGDANADGNVDGLDLGVWQSEVGSVSPLTAAVSNGNGISDSQPVVTAIVTEKNEPTNELQAFVSVAALYADKLTRNEPTRNAYDAAHDSYYESSNYQQRVELLEATFSAYSTPTDELFSQLANENEQIEEDLWEFLELTSELSEGA